MAYSNSLKPADYVVRSCSFALTITSGVVIWFVYGFLESQVF